VINAVAMGSSLSLRSYSRLGSALSVVDFVNFGSSLSVRSSGKFGKDLYTYGKLYFADDTYFEDVSSSLKVTVGGNSAMTLKSTGGTLHGTWYSDTVISVSDRRLKRNIMPLAETLTDNYKQRGGPASSQHEGGLWNGNNNDTSNNNATSLQLGETPDTKSLDWVLRQLRPVSYHFKKGSDAKNMRFGFIADEMEKVLPQVVRELPDQEDAEVDPILGKKKGIVYPDLIAVLTAMMRDFSGQLKAVQARVKTAELELDRLDREEPMTDM